MDFRSQKNNKLEKNYIFFKDDSLFATVGHGPR